MTTPRAVRLFAAAATATLLAAGAPAGSAPASAQPTLRDVVLVGNSAGGTVTVLDGHTFAALGTIPVAADRAQRIAEMDLIERAGYEVVRQQKGGDRFVDDIAVSPDGRTLYVSRSILADVAAYDLVTGAQVWRFEVDGLPLRPHGPLPRRHPPGDLRDHRAARPRAQRRHRYAGRHASPPAPTRTATTTPPTGGGSTTPASASPHSPRPWNCSRGRASSPSWTSPRCAPCAPTSSPTASGRP